MSELSSGGGGASAEYDYDDGAEDNFDKLSDVERIRYFKDRGIDVNVPDSKLKAMVAAAAGDLVPCFTYVRIPANDADLVEELTAMLPLNEDGCVPAGDQIPGLVKPLFADRGGGVDEGLLGEHARAQLGSSAGAVTSRAFHEATVHGSVETYALVRPAAANANAGVYLYLDEVGVIKQLPVNARANALAHACGHAVGTVSFHGDIFVGRVQAVPSPMRNTDFKIADMNSDAAWVRSAPEENYRYAVGMKEVEKALASKGNSQQLNVGGFEEGDLPRGEGKAGRYAWSQTKVLLRAASATPQRFWLALPDSLCLALTVPTFPRLAPRMTSRCQCRCQRGPEPRT